MGVSSFSKKKGVIPTSCLRMLMDVSVDLDLKATDTIVIKYILVRADTILIEVMAVDSPPGGGRCSHHGQTGGPVGLRVLSNAYQIFQTRSSNSGYSKAPLTLPRFHMKTE